MKELNRESNAVQSLQRAFTLLELLAEYPKGAPLSVLTERAGFNKSTTHRILANLIAMGYVAQDELSRHYRLTIRMFEVGSSVVYGMDIVSIAKPYLFDLCHTLGEVVNLAVPDGNDVLYVYMEESGRNAVRVDSHVGARNPMYCTACGKAMMAVHSDSEIAEMWRSSRIRQYTPTTITSFSKLMQEIDEIRAVGYALDNQEYESGIWCLAISIVDYSGNVRGSVSASVPVSRVDDALRELVVKEALDVRRKLCACFGNVKR